MTIGQTSPRVTFNCDGSTKLFPVPLQAYQPTDFLVLLTSSAGVISVLTLNSDYSLSTAGTLQPTQWALTTLAANAYPAGATLQIICSPLEQQQTQYVQGQAFPSLAVQTNFDRVTQMVQRLSDQVGRAILAPDGDVSPNMALVPAAQRKNTNLGFDGNGNVSLFQLLQGTTLSLAALAPFLNLTQTAAEASAGVTPFNVSYAPGNVLRYGTNTTPGTTDMTAAFQAALNQAAQPTGAIAYVPGGSVYLVSSQLTIGSNTKFYGDGSSSQINLSSNANVSNVLGTGVSNTIVANLKFNVTGVPTLQTYQGVVAFVNSTNCLVQGVEVVGFYGDAVNLTGCTKCVLRENFIHGSQGTLGSNSDIHLNGNGGVACTDNLIIGNICQGGSNDFGIAIFQTNPASSAAALRNKVIGNTVDQHAAYGIMVYDAGTGGDTYNILSANTVQNIQGSSGGNVNYGAGIYVANNGAALITGNIVRNCAVTTAGGGLLPAGIAVNVTAGHSGPTITGNAIFDMAQGNPNNVPVAGIWVSCSNNTPGKSVVVSGNTVSQQVAGAIQTGIYVANMNNVQISGNEVNILFTLPGVRGIWVYTNTINGITGVGVDNNIVNGCSVASIELLANGAVTITDASCTANKVSGGAPGSFGLLVGAWVRGSIANNVIDANNQLALEYFSGCTQTRVTGNSFNTTGANCVSLSGVCTGGSFDESNFVSGFPGSFSNTATGLPCTQYGTSSPAAGTFANGDSIITPTPAAASVYQWICTTGGAAPGATVFKTISNT